MIAVLDTTAFSAAMRYESEMMKFLGSLRPGHVATVPPVVAEIEYGIQHMPEESRHRTLLQDRARTLLTHIRVLDWTEDASVHFGSVKSALERDRTPIDDFDVAIAAIALAHRAEVVTANLVHFTRIGELSVRHWRGA